MQNPPGCPTRPPRTESEKQSLATELFCSHVNRNGPFPPSETKVKTMC
jgi:hypothetical protein